MQVYILSHAQCWQLFWTGYQARSTNAYLTFNVIRLRYKEKGTSLMTSPWRSRPPSTSLVVAVRPSNTVLYDDLGQKKGIDGNVKMSKRFSMWQKSFEHEINVLPLVCFRGYGNLSTLSIVTPPLAFGVVLQCMGIWMNYIWGINNFISDLAVYPLFLCFQHS